MVLATKVGKKRPFWRGLLLSIVSFGLYGLYWNYKAHDEVFEQFELKREGRDEGVVWYILGLLVFPLQFVYYWMFVANVRYVRERLNLPAGVSPGGFLALTIGGYVAYFASFIVFFVAIFAVGETATEDQMMAAFIAGFVAILVGVVAMLALLATAYYLLQRDINGVWDAYDARIHELRATGAATAPAHDPWYGGAPPT